jgi:hypothetical protein
LGVVDLAGAEQGFERVVSRDNEAGEVDQELAADVEEDEEEIETDKAEEGVDLGHAGLPLKIVERRVLGQL